MVVIEPLAAIVGMAAALLATLVAADQLTLTARLRRRIPLLREEASAAQLIRDRDVLRSIHREELAKLVSSRLVSRTRLLVSGAFALFAVFVWLSVGYELGRSWRESGYTPLAEIVTSIPDGLAMLIVGLGAILTFVIGVLDWSDTMVERKRVSDAFLSGKLPLRRPGARDPGSASLSEFGKRWGVLVCFGTVGSAAGAFNIGLSIGYLGPDFFRFSAARNEVDSVPAIVGQVLTVLTFVGVVAGVRAFIVAHHRLKSSGSHPAPAPREAHHQGSLSLTVRPAMGGPLVVQRARDRDESSGRRQVAFKGRDRRRR